MDNNLFSNYIFSSCFSITLFNLDISAWYWRVISLFNSSIVLLILILFSSISFWIALKWYEPKLGIKYIIYSLNSSFIYSWLINVYKSFFEISSISLTGILS